MSFRFRGKRRGLRAALIACALIAASLSLMAHAAFATVPCPGAIRSAAIDEWTTRYESRGVTLCVGLEREVNVQGWLQIVDLRGGAQIRLDARLDEEWYRTDTSDPRRTLFDKYKASEWFTFMSELRPREREFPVRYAYFADPEPERLFSTTNASFFKNAENSEPKTALPLPLITAGGDNSMGTAYRETEGPDHEASKRFLKLGYPYGYPHQLAEVSGFPEHYTERDYLSLHHMYGPPEVETFDAAVGFPPEYTIGETARRTYVGVYAEEIVYIFTSEAWYTNAQATEIMQEIRPGMSVVQFDGGGSTQFYSRYGEEEAIHVPIFGEGRRVPTILAVYTARE